MTMSTAPAATWSARSPPTCSRSPRTNSGSTFLAARPSPPAGRPGTCRGKDRPSTASRDPPPGAARPLPGPAVPRWIWAAEQRWLDTLTRRGRPATGAAPARRGTSRHTPATPPQRCSPPSPRRSCSTSARWRATSAMPDSCSWCATLRGLREHLPGLREPHGPCRDPPATCPEGPAAIHVATCLAWQRRKRRGVPRARGLLHLRDDVRGARAGGARDPGGGRGGGWSPRSTT